MALDVVNELSEHDLIVFATADGDLTPCVQQCKDNGKTTLVIGSGISRELKDVASSFEEINEDLLI